MAEVIGEVSAIAGLATFAVQVSAQTYTFVSGVKEASDDINLLQSSLDHLSGVLRVFKVHLIAPQNARNAGPGGGVSEITSAMAGLTVPIKDCEDLLEKLQAKLDLTDVKKGARKAIIALTWPLKEKETSKYTSQLSGFVDLFGFALSCDQL